MRRPPEERFWAMVDVASSVIGCWLWKGVPNSAGYGQLYVDDRAVGAHRFSWTLANGPIPVGRWVLHRCDVKRCVNPAHLFLGTPLENVADMLAKGRQRWRTGSTGLRGETNPRATLTEATALEALARVTAGETQRSVARSLGVSARAVWCLVHGTTWKHLTPSNDEG